ncbi:hypothetical protein NB689_002228 [Xanthomonas sacchari]|nr:hypothetical protein [Xanthomonas sacchari]
MRSVSLPSALSMITAGAPRSLASWRAALRPSSPGIITSRITRSGWRSAIRRRISATVSAVST